MGWLESSVYTMALSGSNQRYQRLAADELGGSNRRAKYDSKPDAMVFFHAYGLGPLRQPGITFEDVFVAAECSAVPKAARAVGAQVGSG